MTNALGKAKLGNVVLQSEDYMFMYLVSALTLAFIVLLVYKRLKK